MTAARVLLTQWQRKDHLTVLVIAVTIAFLTATTILVAGSTGAATTLAADRSSPATLTTTPTPAGAHLQITTATLDTGEAVTIVGGPPNWMPPDTLADHAVIPSFPTAGVNSAYPYPPRLTLHGTAQTVTVATTQTQATILPRPWLAANRSLPPTVGTAESYWLTPTQTTGVPVQGVPLRSVYAFFLAGTTQLQTILITLAAGASILVAVTVYSVTTMTVYDRRDTIAVYRGTGGTGTHITRLLTLRAGFTTVVGLATGYAIGVVATNTAINTAVTLGTPTTLTGTITPTILHQLLVLYSVVFAGGVLAGYIAVRPISTQPVAAIYHTRATSWWPSVLQPQILDGRAFIPTTATITVFVAFVVVILAIGGVLAPLVGTGTATITEPGSPHPLASTVPHGYADVLQAEGIDASPELLVFAVRNGTPFLARGVTYPAYARVTDTTLVNGESPDSRDEAVIGEDLAATLDLDVGDTIPLGGSTTTALTRVTIIGTYTAPGLQDDQLLISLPTAQHLTNKPQDSVHLIRTDPLPPSQTPTQPTVVDISVPQTAVAGTQPTASVTVLNPTPHPATKTITIATNTTTEEQTVDLPAFAHRTIDIPLPISDPGTHTVTIDGAPYEITLHSSEALTIRNLPETAPPGSTPRLTLQTLAGTPVANAAVTIANHTYTTDATGHVRIPLNTTGSYTITATKAGRETTTTITVRETASRTLHTTLTTTPTTPSALQGFTVTATVTNPWNRTLDRTLTLTGPTTTTPVAVTLDPGATTTLTLDQPRVGPGTYDITLNTADGGTLATHTVTVTSNERLATALATSGIAVPGTGIGHAAQALVGNIELLVSVILVLGAVMAIGATTATLVQSVQANQHTIGIYRATGIPPTRLARILLTDTLHVGLPATLLSLALAHLSLQLLHHAGVLTVFGVTLHPGLTPRTIGIAVLAALTILTTATLLTWYRITHTPPATQLTDGDHP